MLIVCDIGGTILDENCMAPIIALQSAFAENGIAISEEEIRKDLGMRKMDHIISILQERVSSGYSVLASKVFEDFIVELKKVLQSRSYPTRGARAFIDWCSGKQFTVALTTGYSRQITQDHLFYAQKNGWKECPSNFVASDEVNLGRPYPYLIFEAMKRNRIKSVAEVFKIGDTDVDIQAALNAGLSIHQTFKFTNSHFDFDLAKDKISYIYDNLKEKE